MKAAFVACPDEQMFPLGPPLDIMISSFAELPDAVAGLKNCSAATALAQNTKAGQP